LRRPGSGVAILAALLATLASAGTAAGDVRVAKGPYVTSVFDTGAEIRFELDQPSPATLTVVREGDSTSLPRNLESADPVAMHVVRATGLEAATLYGYSVRIGQALVGQGQFATAPAPESGAPVTFIAYGDNRTDPTAHAAVARAMLQVPSAFVVNTGDMVEDGSDADAWQTFFGVEAALLRDRPIFAAVGNHEILDDLAGTNFARYFGFPGVGGPSKLYGTQRFGLVRFFFLNGMHGWESGEEREWLERALTSAVVHHGPWASGPHGSNANLLDAGIPELLGTHHVDMVLSGHDHIYERGSSDGLKYLVSGGGGAPLYRIDRLEPTSLKAEAAYHFIEISATPANVKIVARRVDGTVLDRCGFAKGEPWDCDPPRAASPSDAGVLASPRPSSRLRCGCEVGSRGVDRWVLLTTALGVALVRARRHKVRAALR
jgi:3',5'-cyclic AMP phosphodiesterase CpdA